MDKPDIFISHAGENKAFARSLERELRDLGLNAFVDKTALKPGIPADQVMLDAAQQARIGVAVLDQHYLGKKWPMRELRIIMQQRTCLPVLLGVTYEEFSAAAAAAQEAADQGMLGVLRRITMVKAADPFDLPQHAAFAAVQLLVLKDVPKLRNTGLDLDFIQRLQQAAAGIAKAGAMSALSKADGETAQQWAQDLDYIRRQLLMLSEGARLNPEEPEQPASKPQPAELTEQQKTDLMALEQRYNAADNTRQLQSVKAFKRKHERPGDPDHYADVMYLHYAAQEADPGMEGSAEVEAVEQARRDQATFWNEFLGDFERQLPARGQQEGASLKWWGRAQEYQRLLEPVDIAKWYGKGIHKGKHGHYCDQLARPGEDNKRPGRYNKISAHLEQVVVDWTLRKAVEYKATYDGSGGASVVV